MPARAQDRTRQLVLSPTQMVNLMKFSAAVRNELGRALRNFKYEKSPGGILFPQARLLFGGVFGCKGLLPGMHEEDAPWAYGPNAVGNEFINDVLNAKFNATAGAGAWYFAPFANNIAPTASTKAGGGTPFATVQGEYTTQYTEGTRQVFTSNGASTAQSVSNSSAPASITVGAAPITPYGAGLLSVNTKGGTTGVFGAGGLFGTANALSTGSKLLMTYTLTGTSV